MPKKVLVIVPQKGFDPTECAVPVATLSKEPHQIVFTFAVPDPTKKAHCDPIMIDGVGLYLLKWTLPADKNGKEAYKMLEDSKLLEPVNTISYEKALSDFANYDGLLLPGGHCPDMVPYLESKVAQQIVQQFDAVGKPIAAVCHGVVLAGRAGILKQKKVTALEWWMESTAHNMTRLWMGNYYKTYTDRTVESEVSGQCKEFVKGPKGFARDSPEDLTPGFFVRDGNLVTARWPGDVHAFAVEFGKMLNEQK
jgi:protease I